MYIKNTSYEPLRIPTAGGEPWGSGFRALVTKSAQLAGNRGAAALGP